MIELENYVVVGDRAEYRPKAHLSLPKAVAMISSAIALTRERNIRKMLLVTNGFTGFSSPSLHERYAFVNEWARIAAGAMCIAIIAPPEWIDPERFGVKVAQNAGLTSDVFTSEDDALAWLRERP